MPHTIFLLGMFRCGFDVFFLRLRLVIIMAKYKNKRQIKWNVCRDDRIAGYEFAVVCRRTSFTLFLNMCPHTHTHTKALNRTSLMIFGMMLKMSVFNVDISE